MPSFIPLLPCLSFSLRPQATLQHAPNVLPNVDKLGQGCSGLFICPAVMSYKHIGAVTTPLQSNNYICTHIDGKRTHIIFLSTK